MEIFIPVTEILVVKDRAHIKIRGPKSESMRKQIKTMGLKFPISLKLGTDGRSKYFIPLRLGLGQRPPEVAI